MSWKKACLVYCIALTVTVLANIEKVSVWTDDRLADGSASPVARQVRQVRNFWRETGMAGHSRKIDCALAAYFDETYKNTLACRDEPVSEKAEEALRDRLDPNLPLLKADTPVDVAGLLAALSPPRPPLSASDGDGTLPGQGPSSSRAETAGQSRPGARDAGTRKLLVVGDSLAIGLSLSLRRSVAELADVELIEEGKVSSGLANPKYYDWEKALRVFVDKYAPDIVVIMMGANDAKYINPNEKPRPPGSPNKSWPEVFSMRVENFLSVLSAKGIPNYWVGLPIMGDAAYARQAQIMNDIVMAEIAKFKNSRYLDTWPLLADEQGNYSTFLPNEKGIKIKVRANDKVHFTVAGGDILAQSFLTSVAKDVELRPKAQGSPNAAPTVNP